MLWGRLPVIRRLSSILGLGESRVMHGFSTTRWGEGSSPSPCTAQSPLYMMYGEGINESMGKTTHSVPKSPRPHRERSCGSMSQMQTCLLVSPKTPLSHHHLRHTHLLQTEFWRDGLWPSNMEIQAGRTQECHRGRISLI